MKNQNDVSFSLFIPISCCLIFSKVITLTIGILKH